MIDGLKPYPAMKDSGVDWLGKVPEHWGVRKLKTWLAVNQLILSEDTHPDFAFNYLDIGCVGTGQLLASPERLQFKSAPSRARRVVRSADTVISTVRTYLKSVWYVEGSYPNLIASTGFAVLTPKPETCPKFVSYLCQSEAFTDRVTAESVGVAYPAIAESRLVTFYVSVPPLSEQTSIARFLEHANRRIRRYIHAKEKLIALLEEQKQAIIHEAVTGRIDARTGSPYPAYKPSGVEWLGNVPAHWETRRLKTICRIRYGLGQPPPESTNGLPLIRATNVNRGRIVDNDLLYVDPSGVPAGREAILKEGEIIVVRSGAYTADSAIVPRAYAGSVTGYDMVATVVGALPEFVAAALLSSYLRDDQLIVESTRSAQPHLNAEELGSAVLLLPPRLEQSSIVDHLDQMTATSDSKVAKANRQIDLLHEYRTRLISDVVTGKLDVRAAAAALPEEPGDPLAPQGDCAGPGGRDKVRTSHSRRIEFSAAQEEMIA